LSFFFSFFWPSAMTMLMAYITVSLLVALNVKFLSYSEDRFRKTDSKCSSDYSNFWIKNFLSLTKILAIKYFLLDSEWNNTYFWLRILWLSDGWSTKYLLFFRWGGSVYPHLRIQSRQIYAWCFPLTFKNSLFGLICKSILRFCPREFIGKDWRNDISSTVGMNNSF